MRDIILRDCGSVGWLGIVKDENGNEVYRTGKHHPSHLIALAATMGWLEEHP